MSKKPCAGMPLAAAAEAAIVVVVETGAARGEMAIVAVEIGEAAASATAATNMLEKCLLERAALLAARRVFSLGPRDLRSLGHDRGAKQRHCRD